MTRVLKKCVADYLEIGLLAGICLLLVICPYTKVHSRTLFFVCAGLWLAFILLSQGRMFYKEFFQPSILNRPILFFFFACVLSIAASVNPYKSQQIFFSRYLLYFCMFELILTLVKRSSRNLFVIVTAILVSSFIFSGGGIFDYVKHRPDVLRSSWGIRIPFGMYAMYCVYFIPFSYSFFLFSDSRWYKAIGCVNALLQLPGLIWQLSRNAWIAVFSTLSFMSFMKKKRILLFIVLLAAGSILLSPNLKIRMEKILHPVRGWGDRIPEWEAGARIFLDHPITGAGPGMYEKLMFNYQQKYPHLEGTRNQHCHNTYLEVLSEMGIIGLAAFLSIFYVFCGSAYAFIKKNYANRGSFTLTVFIGLTGSILCTLIFALAGTIILVGISEPLMFWCFMGIACGILQQNDITKRIGSKGV